MEREPSISELNELFGAEGYEPFDIELEEDEEKNEGWIKINYQAFRTISYKPYSI